MRKVAVETIDSVRRRLTIEVEQSEVNSEAQRLYEDLARNARVRGFRPGRVPRPVLERLFGDRVRADVFTRLIQDSYAEALREQNIEPVAQPEITTEETAPGGGLRYSAVVEVKPRFELGNYVGLEAERVVRPVTGEEVSAFLGQLRESFAQLVPVTDRKVARAGDIATVDYDAFVGDRQVAKRRDRRVEVLAAGSATDFGSHLDGAEVGKERTFVIEFPEDHPERELAGQRVSFRVQLRGLAVKEVPELDDEFARDHGECDTLEELRAKVRRRLEAQANERADQEVRSALIRKLVEAHDFAVPSSMLARRADAMIQQFFESLGPQRPPAGPQAELAAQLRERLEPEARDQVKATLILEAIAARERIEVTESEVDAAVDVMVRRARGSEAERLRSYYADPVARAALKMQMLQNRAIELVASKARITTIERNSGVADVG